MIGDVFRLKSWKDHPRPHPDASAEVIWMDYTHPDKKLVGVFVLLGFERKDGTGPLVEADAVLIQMGWTPPKKDK